MNLSKKATYFVVTLATLAFIGLTVMQVMSLQSSIKAHQEIFKQKVGVVSSYIGTKFSLKTKYPSILDQAAKRISQNGMLNDPEMDKLMRSLIDPALENNGLDLPYEYAIYCHKEKEDGFRFVMGDEGATLDFQLASCENPQERGHGWTNLTCSQNVSEGDYHLALFFPNQDDYVFSQSWGALGMSGMFIILLMGCFAYTLIIIRKQKRLSEIKNDFINNLTHEFKTPLASIALASRMLDASPMEKQKKEHYLKIIKQEGKRLEGHVDKVLQMAMIDSGNFSLEKKIMDLHEVIKAVVESMNLSLEKKNGIINLNLRSSNANVYADESHIVNIIYNLIDNAIKYSPNTPDITITTADEKEGISISIKDRGIGIGKEVQKYIFDSFYRAETGNVHNVKGFGLGLSYVKKIIDAHKGSINLISTLNKGTEFNVYLPSGH